MKFYYRYGEEGLRGSLGPVIISLIFVVLLLITGFNFFYRSKRYTKELVAHDLQQLQTILMRIDKKCKIISLDYQKNTINFLNVGCFKGSEVGPLNLAYPSEWEGPYLDNNPTLQGVEYQIVRAKDGYFILPGQGVELPNGKVMGKDIVITNKTAVAPLLKDQKALSFNGVPMGCALPLKIDSWGTVLMEQPITPAVVG